MLNQEPRMGIPLNSSTTRNVGPTTYIICDRESKKYPCYHPPFYSTAERKTGLIGKPACDTYYDIETCEKITGGSSPQSKSPRVAEKVYCSPGPGDYELDDTKEKPRKCGVGKLYVCKVPLSLKGAGPSVPSRINENGYSLDKDGKPIRNPPNDYDMTLGPAFYEVKASSFGELYRGCKWSRRTSIRSCYRTTSSPGPADYCPQMASCIRHKEDEMVREMARKTACIPRFLDAQTAECIRENLPGPAHYGTPKKDTCKRCEGIYPAPLVVRSERFKGTIREGPSPASYEIDKEFKYPASKIEHRFGVRCARFPGKATAATPGPADYNIPSAIMEKTRRNEFALRSPPFGKTAQRKTVEISTDAACTPSPAEYVLRDGKKCRISVTSVFRSGTPRFPEYKASPGDYDVLESFRITNGPKSFNASDGPTGGRSLRKTFIDMINVDNPAPGEYEGGVAPRTCRGAPITTSSRFPRETPTCPGPGSYEARFSDSAMYKAYKTRNLKIMENVLRKKLRRHPMETWEEWMRGVKGRKNLRCFYDEIAGFMHC